MSVAGHALPLFTLRLHEISPLIDMGPFGQMVIYGKNWDQGKERLVAQRLPMIGSLWRERRTFRWVGGTSGNGESAYWPEVPFWEV